MLSVVSLNFSAGGGHLFAGLTLWQAFRDALAEPFRFTILTDAPFDLPREEESLEVIQIFLEPDKYFTADRETVLYQYLVQIDPDILIVDHIWFPLQGILPLIRSRWFIFFRYIFPGWFNPPVFSDGSVHAFDPESYDLAFVIEPGFSVPGCVPVSPSVNTAERHRKDPGIIRDVLRVPKDKKLALVAHIGYSGEAEELIRRADCDPDEYCLRSLSLREDESRRLFPLAHYLSGVDLAIGGCGYNFFYETRSYGLAALYTPQKRPGDEQLWRFAHNRDYSGPFDGARQMVERMLALV